MWSGGHFLKSIRMPIWPQLRKPRHIFNRSISRKIRIILKPSQNYLQLPLHFHLQIRPPPRSRLFDCQSNTAKPSPTSQFHENQQRPNQLHRNRRTKSRHQQTLQHHRRPIRTSSSHCHDGKQRRRSCIHNDRAVQKVKLHWNLQRSHYKRRWAAVYFYVGVFDHCCFFSWVFTCICDCEIDVQER